MKYVTHKGEVLDIETMSTPHLINAMRKLINEAEKRRTRHLRYQAILNPFLVITAPDLVQYFCQELKHIIKELIKRGYLAECNAEIKKHSRISDECIMIMHYLHVFGIYRRACALEILQQSIEEAYETQRLDSDNTS